MRIQVNWCAALGAAALFAFAGAAASAAPAYVKSTVNLRAGPDTSNEVLGKIPGGSLVEAENCDNGWCAVTWQGKSGFAIKTALDTSGRVPAARRVARSPTLMPYEDEDEVVVGAPLYYPYPYPYYRPFGYYRHRPYYGYRGGWRGRW